MNEEPSKCPEGGILALCEDLKANLERKISIKKDRDVIDGLAKDLELVRESHSEAKESLTLIRLLRDAKILNTAATTIESDNTDFQKKIGTLKTRIEKDPSKLRQGNVWASFDNLVRKIPKDARKYGLSDWRRYVNDQIPSSQTWLAFENIERCRAAIQEMRKIEVDKAALLNIDSLSKENLDKVLKLGTRMHVLIDSLDLKDQPTEMIDFLKRCAGEGVSMSELSDKILKWLRDNKFVESLRIKTK
jgi:hypothetical protein